MTPWPGRPGRGRTGGPVRLNGAVTDSAVTRPYASRRLVWYAAYGSNLSRRRFLAYLEGGAASGSSRPLTGARDDTPPRADAPHEAPYPVVFRRWSDTWGGAVAFCAVQPVPGHRARMRRWLITTEQLADVIAQENALPPGSVTLGDLSRLSPGQIIDVVEGWYGTLVVLGTVGGVPVVTITNRDAVSEPAGESPSAAYIAHMIDGLVEAHGLSRAEAEAYLASVVGAGARA